MINLKVFLVTYDRLYDKVVEQLTEKERNLLVSYQIQKKVCKNISNLLTHTIKEWEFSWNDYSFQSKQYYEYSLMIHLYKNYEIIQNLSHIGLFHYDVIFNKHSIIDVQKQLELDPNIIFFQKKRSIQDLYLNPYELTKLCEFMSNKLDMNIDPKNIWHNGWYSEALSITPKNIFLKFGKYLYENYNEIEDILINNRWGIMNRVNHRVCGIVERMWGFYLASHQIPQIKLDVIHDWDSYIHKHSSEENWIK